MTLDRYDFINIGFGVLGLAIVVIIACVVGPEKPAAHVNPIGWVVNREGVTFCTIDGKWWWRSQYASGFCVEKDMPKWTQ